MSAFVALQNADNVKKAAGQLVGVSGRDYRVYFYSTYVNQLSKGKANNKSVGNAISNVTAPSAQVNNTSSPTSKNENGKKLEQQQQEANKEKRKRHDKGANEDEKQHSDDSNSSVDTKIAEIKKIKSL